VKKGKKQRDGRSHVRSGKEKIRTRKTNLKKNPKIQTGGQSTYLTKGKHIVIWIMGMEDFLHTVFHPHLNLSKS
jgi:hypothetical protein